MADAKISALTAVASVVDAQEFAVNDAGVSKKATALQVKAYMATSLSNQSTADQTPTAATLTYLTGSNISVPVGKLRVGTTFRWKLYLIKTAAGTATSTFDVRIGTAGTTADASRLAFTTDVGTAVVDTATVEITATCRGPLSASGIFAGGFLMNHDLAITGFGTKAMRVAQVTSSAFDVTTANLIVGLTLTSGAAQAWTFKQVVAEARNL